MKKQIIYISGAIGSNPAVFPERMAAFAAATELWQRRGFRVINPFLNGVPQTAHWRRHMLTDIHNLSEDAAAARVSYIYMLRGWEQSKGAKLEFDIATSCGITPVYETDNLATALTHRTIFPEMEADFDPLPDNTDPSGISDENTPDDFADMNAG